MAKLKGLDFKTLFLNHGEKFGAGIAALLALTGLATASWIPCERETTELEEIALATKNVWASQSWDGGEGPKKFADTPPVEAMAQRMASPNEDADQFMTRLPWNPPIIPLKEKLAAVTVLPPETPEATLVEFTMAEKPDVEEVTKDEKEKKEDKPAKKPASDEDLQNLLGAAGATNQLGGGELGNDLVGGGLGLGGLGDGGLGGGLPGGNNSGSSRRRGGGLGGPGGGLGGPGGGMGSSAGMGSSRGMGMSGRGMGGMGMGGRGMGGMGMGMGMGADDDLGEDMYGLGGGDGYGMD
jgi:hypothetical protein